MSGLGAPIGVYPYGSGTPAATNPPPDNGPERAAYIDPVTRDYVIGDDGELERMPGVRQQVMLALTTRKGSAGAALNFGVQLPGRVSSDFKRVVESSVRLALSHIVSAGRMLLQAVQVELGEYGRTLVTVQYRDLTADKNDVITV